MAATSIVRLSLESNQYEQGLRGAKKQFEDFSASIGINMKKMTAYGLAAGAAASAINGLTSAISEAFTEGTRMAKEMEGVRAAFNRLDQPGLLDNLREATHGTVNDLELMKQAVKFDNFNLSLEQMGTMLEFAQQQAKDTGQDVGYLVDSIVTGLGRKSLPILDNLGLSATEIRERMKETGDMTKAVADIIQDRMKAAGGYVETASDRAAKATAELENAMTSLGETFAPLIGASDSLWSSIKIGAINALNTAVKPLIQALAEAGALGQGARSTAGFNRLGGGSKVDRMIGRLGNGKSAGAYSIYQQQLGEFDKYINNKRFQIAAYGGDNSSVAKSAKAKLQTELDGALKMREEYVKRAQELHNKVPSPYEPTASGVGGGGRSGGGSGGSHGGFDVSKIAFDPNKALLSAVKGEDTGPSEVWKAITEGAKESTSAVEELTTAFEKLNKVQGVTTGEAAKDSSTMADKWQQAGTAISAVGSAMSQIEDPAAKVASTIAQAIATIVLTYAASLKGTFTPWDWIAAAVSGVATMVGVISAIHSATGYAEGGIIKGNSYSGDNIGGMVDGGTGGFVGLNAGEVVLNAAQQNTLAQNLQGGGGNFRMTGEVSGEKIVLVANRYLKRTGQGEIVTW